MSTPTVLYEKTAEGIAWVTLNRPEVLNAYNIRMRDELFEVLQAVRDDDEIRVMALRGAGRGFCARADLTEFGTAPSPTEGRRIRFARDVWGVFRSIHVPKVAVLHGFVFGSGLEMALFCEVRLVARGTLLGFPETRLGMIPAAGGTQTLPRTIGRAAALDLLLTGRRISAEEALSNGLASAVVDAAELAAEAERMCNELSALRPAAVKALLRAVSEGTEMSLAQGLALEARLVSSLRTEAV